MVSSVMSEYGDFKIIWLEVNGRVKVFFSKFKFIGRLNKVRIVQGCPDT